MHQSLLLVDIDRFVSLHARIQNRISTLQVSTQASVSNADGSYSFVKSRTAYRAEVATLRQEFITEVARRKEKLARDAEYVCITTVVASDIRETFI